MTWALPTPITAGITTTCRRLRRSIYTFIGHVPSREPVPVAADLRRATMVKYVRKQRVDVAPHIFATAAAYRAMLLEADHRAPSSAASLARARPGPSRSAFVAPSGGGARVERAGRAARVEPAARGVRQRQDARNNSSPRFGKYLELRFDAPAGRRAATRNYLLEKARACRLKTASAIPRLLPAPAGAPAAPGREAATASVRRPRAPGSAARTAPTTRSTARARARR